MVTKLAEIEPRSSGETTVPNSENSDGDFFYLDPRERTVFIFQNDLDVYAEATIEATHSRDQDFTNSLTNEEGLPVRPGRTREVAFTDSNEIVELVVRTPTAPSSGSLTVWSESDHTPMQLDSTRLNEFKELNEGRTYSIDFQDTIADTNSITAGIRNPSDSDVSVFVKQFGISVGGDALATTEIDHDSYTDGTALTVINKKPELQVERPVSASVTRDPTISGAQESMTGFLPGGSAGNAAIGGRFRAADYELSPGQDLTVSLQNISGSSSNYGFSLELIETVVR